jgi:hypothetical protein
VKEKKMSNMSANVTVIRFTSVPFSAPQIPCESSSVLKQGSKRQETKAVTHALVINTWNISLYKSHGDTDDQEIQAVSRWLVTPRARIRSWRSPCGICGGRSGTGIAFSKNNSVPTPLIIAPVFMPIFQSLAIDAT